jgi:hypothetical protein
LRRRRRLSGTGWPCRASCCTVSPASDIFCAKRSIPPPFAPRARAQRLRRMAQGPAGDPEAGRASRGRSAAERPQGVPRLPEATARVPGESTHLVSEVLSEPRQHPGLCWDKCAAARVWGYLFRISSVRGSSLLFFAMGCCFPKNHPASMLGIRRSG